MRPTPCYPTILLGCAFLTGCVAHVATVGSVKRPASAAAPVAATASAATPTSATTHGGSVLSLSGAPAAGVVVRAFPANLLSDNGGGIVSNNGGTLTAKTKRLLLGATTLATTTDLGGHFSLALPAGQAYNVEAVQANDVKAIALNTTDTDGLTLQLAYTGAIAGNVTSKLATDLTGVDVFVPGTGYEAKTDAAGHYTIANVPPGVFTLYASKPELGTANADGVVVTSKASAAAPTLSLSRDVPTLDALTPAAGPRGSEVTLAGSHFGFKTGAEVQVTFGGVVATRLTRVDDQTAKVTVPEGATSGDVVVTVGGAASNARRFVVAKAIAVDSLSHDLLLGRPEPIGAVVTGPDDAPVPDAAVQWSADGQVLQVDDHGLVTPRSAGQGKLTATLGSLSASLDVTVHADVALSALCGGPAGQGPSGHGTDGPTTAATFTDIMSLAFRPNGDLVIGDGGDVRVWTPGSGVTRLASLPAGPQPDDPVTSVAATADTVYLTRRLDNQVYKVRDGQVSTVAGQAAGGFADGAGAAARFAEPVGLAIDADGSVLVGDAQNDIIRRIASDGTVSTFAGTFKPGLDLGMGTTGTPGDADGPAAQASFNTPEALLAAPDGRTFVRCADAVRVIAPDHTVSTLAGFVEPNGPIGPLQPLGEHPVFDPDIGWGLLPGGDLVSRGQMDFMGASNVYRLKPDGSSTLLLPANISWPVAAPIVTLAVAPNGDIIAATSNQLLRVQVAP